MFNRHLKLCVTQIEFLIKATSIQSLLHPSYQQLHSSIVSGPKPWNYHWLLISLTPHNESWIYYFSPLSLPPHWSKSPSAPAKITGLPTFALSFFQTILDKATWEILWNVSYIMYLLCSEFSMALQFTMSRSQIPCNDLWNLPSPILLSFWLHFHLLSILFTMFQPHWLPWHFLNISGIRVFGMAVLSAQNAIPLDVCMTKSLTSFNSLLKWHPLPTLFNAEYCHLLLYHSWPPDPTLLLVFSMDFKHV